MEIRIDKEFRELIPPLGDDERSQLEKNILLDGCRDPLVVWDGLLIDGHNRYEICTNHNLPFQTVSKSFASRNEAKIWIIKNQFGRRNLAPYAIGELAIKLEPLFASLAKANQGKRTDICQNSDKSSIPIDTKKELAKATGGRLSHDTIAKVKLIHNHADEQTKHKLRTNQVSINRVAKDIKEDQKKKEREAKRQEAACSIKVESKTVIIGDFRQKAGAVADGSVSLIFTDPPYDRDSIELFDPLGRFAADKLCDGGSLVCYVGHIQLFEAYAALSKHLRHWWTICCLHSGGASLMSEYGIRANWKPVLWFVKGTRHDKQTIVSDVMSGGREKSHHDWQQAESEAEYWINNLTSSGEFVVDPFVGGGTTGVVAIKSGRQFVGFEIDELTAIKAIGRIAK